MNVERRRHLPPTILLPLEGARASAAALPVARRMAALTGATLHVVYLTTRAVPLDAIRERLALSKDQFEGLVIDQVEGDAVAGIVRLAKRHMSLMIVMMRYGEDARHESGVGVVTACVLTAAPCPVLVIPPGLDQQTWRLTRVMLPQDGTPESATGAAPVVRLAERAEAELVVVYIGGYGIAPPAAPGSLAAPRYMDQPQHEWPTWVGEFVERMEGLCRHHDGRLRFFLAHGDVGDEIVRLASENNADLVALFWHGNFEFGRASALKMVLGNASCPTLVIPIQTVPQFQGQLERL